MGEKTVATNWRTVKLGELVSFKTGKLDSNAAVPNGDYPFFTCSQETLRTNTNSFDTECVLLAGNNANGIFPLKYFQGKFDAYQRTYIIRPRDNDDLTTKFLYYSLRPKLSEFRSFSTGAATKFLTLTILNETEIKVPPLPVQKRIAGILSAYDDLIENSQRRIKILETMARALYREWFVLFRFPGHEKVGRVKSAMGDRSTGLTTGIPEGWEVRKLGELTEYLSRGLSPIYDENGNSIVINQKCIRDQHLNLEPARRQTKVIPPDKKIRFGDVLINSTGVGTLGRVTQVYQEIVDCTVDTHVTIARPHPNIDIDFFGLMLMLHQEAFEKLGIGATGQTELNRTSIANEEVIVPNSSIQVRFGEIIGPMRKKAVTHAMQIQNIRRTRDLLLPRLLSGQVDLKAN